MFLTAQTQLTDDARPGQKTYRLLACLVVLVSCRIHLHTITSQRLTRSKWQQRQATTTIAMQCSGRQRSRCSAAARAPMFALRGIQQLQIYLYPLNLYNRLILTFILFNFCVTILDVFCSCRIHYTIFKI